MRVSKSFDASSTKAGVFDVAVEVVFEVAVAFASRIGTLPNVTAVSREL
jgi:hypothetical protein